MGRYGEGGDRDMGEMGYHSVSSQLVSIGSGMLLFFRNACHTN